MRGLGTAGVCGKVALMGVGEVSESWPSMWNVGDKLALMEGVRWNGSSSSLIAKISSTDGL